MFKHGTMFKHLKEKASQNRTKVYLNRITKTCLSFTTQNFTPVINDELSTIVNQTKTHLNRITELCLSYNTICLSHKLTQCHFNYYSYLPGTDCSNAYLSTSQPQRRCQTASHHLNQLELCTAWKFTAQPTGSQHLAYSVSSDLDMYVGGTEFKSWPHYQVLRLRFLRFS